MRAPIRAIRGRWPASWERRAPRLFRIDPRVLLEEAPSTADFRAAMSILHVGQTIKITDADRHAAADALLIENVDLADAVIVDIGASDGTTSVELMDRIGQFRSYVIADLYLEISATRLGRWMLFRDPQGVCILVAGRRLLAWPSLSRPVRWLCAPLLALSRGRPSTTVALLGPAARERLRTDPRVTTRTHDVFEPWPRPAPDVIKVANLLRRLYFSDEAILQALGALHAGLGTGGHLLLLDNPRIEGVSLRAGLYRRTDEGFDLVAQTEHPPEIADLMVSPDLAASSR